ncbi:MAG: DUF4160 domain-containing protein [Betaproteobacteria bacterium]|nr:DUF4160 domain-containing protein [Betaproteobacteria bacterium]
MPTLKRLTNGKIAMYANDHGEPHFHVETPDGRCSVSIVRLAVIVGGVDRVVLDEALAWARENQDVLQLRWKELNS